MTPDFLFGFVVGVMVGGVFGAMAMAVLAAASDADDMTERWMDGRRGAGVACGDDLGGDGAGGAGAGGAVNADKERADFYYRLWAKQ